MIRKLHHNAYRCRDSEQTRAFYEDFLGLPLVNTFEIGMTKTGRATHALHTFYRLDDGSHLAFFETSDMPFEFKPQHDFDLHIALEVEPGADSVAHRLGAQHSSRPGAEILADLPQHQAASRRRRARLTHMARIQMLPKTSPADARLGPQRMSVESSLVMWLFKL